jgi:glycosyltransferase involved in cell wall biosynthesis
MPLQASFETVDADTSETPVPRHSGVGLIQRPNQSPWTVLHVAEAWKGGVGIYLESLIRQQLNDARLAEVHLVCSESRTPEQLGFESHPKLHVHRYASSRKPWRVLSSCRNVKRIVEEVGPSLVHLHSTFAGLYGRLYDLGCPVVYCAHGWAFTQDVPWPLKWVYAVIEGLLALRTAALIHISQHELRAAWSYHVRAPINRVILNGVRRPTYTNDAPLAVDPTRLNLGFVGRLDRQKGHETLLRAVQALDRDDVHVYVLGDFDRQRAQASQTLESGPRWTRLGWVPPDQIDNYLRVFDAVVVPSRWEGFGLVASEAMRNGKPVIVSDRGGLPEQVVHGFNGLVFPMDDSRSLAQLLQVLDKTSLAHMGRNAKAVWDDSFFEGRAYRELMVVYADVMSRAAPRKHAAASTSPQKRSRPALLANHHWHL